MNSAGGARERVVLEVALARALLWTQGDRTLAASVFKNAQASCAPSWVTKSAALLRQFGIPDWPGWMTEGMPSGSYKAYVRNLLVVSYIQDWRADVSAHVIPMPYLSVSSEPCSHLTKAFALRLVGQRCVMRLRCGYVCLGHVDGKVSKARVTWCIFCNRRYSSMFSHVACACPCLRQLRGECEIRSLDCSTLLFLACEPEHVAYVALTNLARHICDQADDFWRGRH